ncbi:unnamed protein product [Vitrella brassicaformis CCMP3155]|uniref:Calnexin n=2 Tax=Vitrella brassicaformis TaxID=1169539 RepID=A0A0G4G237_VITBC|nr:unnamed protein product [Vitrella brassicaformis CCMP3155]|eukprot:CEM22137.1 unnamed protein product [Vitrella brassicaformis CCMP3155]
MRLHLSAALLLLALLCLSQLAVPSVAQDDDPEVTEGDDPMMDDDMDEEYGEDDDMPYDDEMMGGGGPPGMGEEMEDEEEGPSEPVQTVDYAKPDTEGLLFAELFDADWSTRWQKSKADKFTGEWKHSLREKEAIVGDYALEVGNEARHHGVAVEIPEVTSNKDGHFVVQYEVKFQRELQCGGAYLKLFKLESGTKPEDFTNDTPYVIMFGPDRCGTTNKVHFILRHQNPTSKEWSEKHFSSPPSVPYDQLTHLYALHIKPDNTFDILIDNKVEKSGSLLKDMEPPINPPEMIDDPTDKKPDDWVDNPKMEDPEAKKPDDWDEDAPKRIRDPDAKMPEGWLEDEPLQVADPSSVRPEDWDDEEDGEWTAPLVDNPKCKVGCGKWEAPMIDNPNYKGKWTPPLIDNPNYKGEWKARQIKNPDYFVDNAPHALSPINAIGIELWTMQSGILFDNIVVSRDMAKAKAFGEATWKVRHDIEDKQSGAASSKKKDKASSFINTIKEGFMSLSLSFQLSIVAIALSTMILMAYGFGRRSAKPTTKRKGGSKKDKGAAASSKDDKDKQEGAEGDDEAEDEQEGEGEGEGEGEEREGEDKKDDKAKKDE